MGIATAGQLTEALSKEQPDSPFNTCPELLLGGGRERGETAHAGGKILLEKLSEARQGGHGRIRVRSQERQRGRIRSGSLSLSRGSNLQ